MHSPSRVTQVVKAALIVERRQDFVLEWEPYISELSIGL